MITLIYERCPDKIKEWLDKRRKAEQEAQADKVRWEYEQGFDGPEYDDSVWKMAVKHDDDSD